MILSGEEAQFQIPDRPGQPSNFALAGLPADPSNPAVSAFDSSRLNENQNEQNYYAIEAYQKSMDDVSFQLSTFQRSSSVLFRPDETGDLVFNGVASRVDQGLFANGLQDGHELVHQRPAHAPRRPSPEPSIHAIPAKRQCFFPATARARPGRRRSTSRTGATGSGRNMALISRTNGSFARTSRSISAAVSTSSTPTITRTS